MCSSSSWVGPIGLLLGGSCPDQLLDPPPWDLHLWFEKGLFTLQTEMNKHNIVQILYEELGCSVKSLIKPTRPSRAWKRHIHRAITALYPGVTLGTALRALACRAFGLDSLCDARVMHTHKTLTQGRVVRIVNFYIKFYNFIPTCPLNPLVRIPIKNTLTNPQLNF